MLNICHTRDKRSQAEILNLGCSLVSLGRFEDIPMLSKYSAHCGVGIGMKFVPKVLEVILILDLRKKCTLLRNV